MFRGDRIGSFSILLMLARGTLFSSLTQEHKRAWFVTSFNFTDPAYRVAQITPSFNLPHFGGTDFDSI